MSSFVFRETLMTHLLLWGNAYSQIIRNGKNEIIALYCELFSGKIRSACGRCRWVELRAVDVQVGDVGILPRIGGVAEVVTRSCCRNKLLG